jgi:hypothetical protein
MFDSRVLASPHTGMPADVLCSVGERCIAPEEAILVHPRVRIGLRVHIDRGEGVQSPT